MRQIKQTFKIALIFLLGSGAFLQVGAQRVIGYMPSWSGDANTIQYSKLTHINYAFALPNSDGSIKALDNPGKLQTIVSLGHAKGVKVLISVGGWSDGGTPLDPTFETLAADATSRSRFVTACMSLVSQYGVDGIDIDWEYPDPGQSSTNYDLVMGALSTQLKAQGKLLTTAVIGNGSQGDGIPASVFAKIDWLNIMAYDENEFQHSTYDYALQCLSYWAGRGIAKSKINLGVPFYGHPTWESYATLVGRGADPNADVFGNVGYNGIVTIKKKTQYVKDNAYGGIMIWELSQDLANQNSLVSAIYSITGTTTPPVNQAPTITLTAPANNASYTAPASITITAAASDADGTVSKVEFYNGATLIGTDLTSPYSFTWTSVAAGTYPVTAKATDDKGAATSTASINVIVNSVSNQAPTVTLTAPANNTSYTAPASITITATASDADGTVSKVEFYNGAALIGTDLTSPYSFTWTNVAAGTYFITAKATDDKAAATSTAAVSVVVTTVSGTNQAPTITLTAPTNNGTYNAPAAVTIMATANDADGTVSKVEFYNGATLIGTDNTSPYSFTWTNVGGGTYVITAKATDDKGASTSTPSINVVVYGASNQAPAVTLTAPANNTSYTAPASITITATASDADGTVSKVEFYNGATLIGTDLTSPYSFTWTSVAAGTYVITAKATDDKGAATSTASINVIVTSISNQAPTVTLTAPANNTSYTAPASITITATASDADGTVSKVEFYNGAALIGTDLTSPYSFTWTNVAAGTYSITAKATDDKGAATSTLAVSVAVQAVTGGSCTTAAWNAATIYTVGNRASRNGNIYEAKWWTQGEDPLLSGQWDVWKLIGACNARIGTMANTDSDVSASANYISVSPNPSTGMLYVDMNTTDASVMDVKLFDSFGHEVFSAKEVKSGEALNIQSLAVGIYVMKITAGSQILTQRVVRQ